jgi:hypothetical protein
MEMSDEEYEDVYREALLSLSEALSVGEPFIAGTGKRVCSVGGVLLEDQQVLERWWGEEIVQQIRRDFPKFGAKAKVRSIRSE